MAASKLAPLVEAEETKPIKKKSLVEDEKPVKKTSPAKRRGRPASTKPEVVEKTTKKAASTKSEIVEKTTKKVRNSFWMYNSDP